MSAVHLRNELEEADGNLQVAQIVQQIQRCDRAEASSDEENGDQRRCHRDEEARLRRYDLIGASLVRERLNESDDGQDEGVHGKSHIVAANGWRVAVVPLPILFPDAGRGEEGDVVDRVGEEALHIQIYEVQAEAIDTDCGAVKRRKYGCPGSCDADDD